jgi:hypothetical protein
MQANSPPSTSRTLQNLLFARDGTPPDATEAQAIARLKEMLWTRPELYYDLMLEPDDIQFVNNRLLMHGRTHYEDWGRPTVADICFVCGCKCPNGVHRRQIRSSTQKPIMRVVGLANFLDRANRLKCRRRQS